MRDSTANVMCMLIFDLKDVTGQELKTNWQSHGNAEIK